MTHRTNGRPGPCAQCQVSVAAGAGTLLGPPWKVICQACLPFPAAGPASAVIIAVTKVSDAQLEVAPSGKLGSATWGTYKGILDRVGVRARKDKAGTWHSLGPVACAPELVKALTDAGFVLSVASDVTAAVEAQAKSATLDVAAADERVAAVDAELAKRGKSLYPFQREGVAWLAPRTSALLADDMGCIDGQAIISYSRAGLTRKLPLAEFYRRFNGIQPAGKRWDKAIPTYVKSLCGDELRLHRITAVLDRGIKAVLCMTLASGKTLRLTPDHEVCVGVDHWLPAHVLKRGDVVLTNGRMVGPANPNWKGGKALDKDGYVRVSGHRDHPRCNEHGQVLEHHLVMEKHLGRYLAEGEEVHHKNEKKNDNRLSNLELTAKAAHMAHHGRKGGFRHLDGARGGKGGLVRFIPVEDRVVSVKEDGRTHVYDIVCEDPHRNFVANGIIVHNCGKTVQMLAAVPTAAPALVICPAVAKGVWVRETKAWRPDLTPVKVDGRGRFRWPTAGEVLIMNDELLPAVELKTGKLNEDGEPIMEPAPFLADAPAGLVVIHDECHRGKNSKAARTKRVRAICKAARGAGGRSFGISGTPLMNDPPDLWSVLSNFGLATEAFGSWFSFARAMGGHQEEIRARGRQTVKVWVWGGTPTSAAGPALRRVMLRRTKDEVLPDLPAKTYKQVDVEIEDKELVRQLELLQEAADEAGGWGNFFDDDHGDSPRRPRDKEKMLAIDFSEISETRARLANAKLAAALEVVAEYEDAGEPVIVFSAHRAPIETLGKRDGWRAIVGGMPAAERTQIEDDFQAGRLKGVALTIGAGGVAITLTRASNAIFIDRSWTPAENQQAEDRIRRIGTTKAVQITDLVAEHPLDQQVTTLLVAKQNVINASVEAARVGAGQHAVNAAQVASGALGAIAGQDERLAAAAASKAAYEAQLQALLAGLVADEQAELARAAAEKADPAKALERRIERAWSRFVAQDAGDPRPAASPAEFWALGALAHLAASDADYAQEDNGVGFNKADCGIGHALARAATSGLTEGGWRLAISVASYYPGQVGRAPKGEES